SDVCSSDLQNTGDLALDGDYAQQWLEAITDEQATPGQASALGLVVSRGTWSKDFLTTLAQGVYDYEREYDREGMWRERVSGGLSSEMYGAVDPVHGDDDGAPPATPSTTTRWPASWKLLDAIPRRATSSSATATPSRSSPTARSP